MCRSFEAVQAWFNILSTTLWAPDRHHDFNRVSIQTFPIVSTAYEFPSPAGVRTPWHAIQICCLYWFSAVVECLTVGPNGEGRLYLLMFSGEIIRLACHHVLFRSTAQPLAAIAPFPSAHLALLLPAS